MQLSIIIVNYNVKYFLEQCLCSVRKALQAGSLFRNEGSPLAEVIVVDNHSKDGSIAYLRSRFSFVQFVANKENTGFSKANNQALKLAKGRYVLFLNPDTILPEDILTKAIAFLEKDPAAGALGVRMVDGSGRFLKESRRGIPTAWVSFCKMSGLTSLFPRSAFFARYYLGHLPEDKTQPVPVLSGAFLMARKEVLDKVSGFDERFFMYAEDIDLSYRILKEGYKNYYFADATIIHFKGESTRKDERYVRLFYKAMQQFVQKHYRSGGGVIFRMMLSAGISLRSSLERMKKKNIDQNSEPVTQATLIGDERVITELVPLLKQCRISIEPNADTLILCEGPGYSFAQMITRLQQLQPHQKALLHAGDSSCVVGSSDKNEQGMVLPIVTL